jgi:glycosyltransferase involved in cell wall biosynthesis
MAPSGNRIEHLSMTLPAIGNRMPEPPPISVLVRTFNSEKTLARLISRLDLTVDDEVLVVDSASQDATRDVARRLGAKVVDAPLPFSYSKSLNAGFKVAKTPVVLVLSSHVVPMVPDLLARMRTLAATVPTEVWAIYGPAGISGRDELGTREAIVFDADQYAERAVVIGNANTLYRIEAWRKLPFDESIRTDEDKTWARAALALGGRLAYSPEIPVLNKSSYPLSYMFRKGQSDARAIKKEDAPPMTFWQFGAALKQLAAKKLRCEINWGNWIRYTAHICGQFSGSRMPKDNTPRTNPDIRP